MSAQQHPIEKYFPFQTYREGQREVLIEAYEALYEDDYNNVVIDAPTGVGKSPICVALGRYADRAFYTTPQTSLREQLVNDTALSNNGEHYTALRARKDYSCDSKAAMEANSREVNCEDCPANRDPNKSCMDMKGCNYWIGKEAAMQDDLCVLTFAYLIVDGHIPVVSEENGRQISFGHRDMVIADEIQSLDQQAASLFAGFPVSPNVLPGSVYEGTAQRLQKSMVKIEEVKHILDDLAEKAASYISDNHHTVSGDVSVVEGASKDIERCERFLNKYQYCMEELDEGRDWVVDVDHGWHRAKQKKVLKMDVKPVKVDRFLREKVWSRGDKRVLSTATMPYRGNPDQWFEELGLDPDETKVVSADMPFDAANRPIHLDTIIGDMRGDGMEENWGEVVQTVKDLHSKHNGQKGLIHTSSYKRAKKLGRRMKGQAMIHEQNSLESTDDVIQKWQRSSKDILLSPAMEEGVDLEGDMCEWQVLLKVPFMSIGDSRVKHKLYEENDNQWYEEATANMVIQSVGRGVRSKVDECDYYVLDEAFIELMADTNPPEWFTDAFVPEGAVLGFID